MRKTSWIIWIGAKSNDKYPYKRHKEEREREKRSDENTEVDMEMPRAS